MMDRVTGLSRRTMLKGAAAGAAVLYAPAVLAQDKKLSLMLLGPDQNALAWAKQTLADFKAQQGYEVELRQSDWGSGFQKLLTAAASGTMADVSMMGQVMTPALASKGAFLPIGDRLAAWSDTDKFYPAMLKDGTYDGKSYAVPVYADVRTAVYRSDFLEAVGVGPDALPKTWDDFKAVAKKLSKAEGGPLDAPFFANQDKSVGLMQTFSQMLYQADGGFFDDAGKSVLSSKEGVRALDYLVSFYNEGLANPNVVYQGTGPRPLVQGTAGMTYNSVTVSQNAAQTSPEVQAKILAGIPLTADAGGTPKTIAWINKLGIGATTKDPDGAWALLTYLAGYDGSLRFAELWGGLPARTDQSDAPFLDEGQPGLRRGDASMPARCRRRRTFCRSRRRSTSRCRARSGSRAARRRSSPASTRRSMASTASDLAAGAARTGTHPRKDPVRQQRATGTLLVAPAVLVMAATSIVPLLLAFYFSLTDYTLLAAPRWAGLANYRAILADPVFWEAIRHTLTFAVSQVGIGIVVVVMVAALFNGYLYGGPLMRTIVYLPQAASYVVVALVWTLLLDPAVGPINAFLAKFGQGPAYFLSDPRFAMPSIVVMSLWRNLGYFMIIVLAALKSVPRDLLEAAEMDGANAVQRFFTITLPLIRGVVTFVAITWFLGALQMFTQSYVMTGGGPVNATRTIVYLMYDEAFTNLAIGKACAMAVMLFLLVVVLSLVLRVVFRPKGQA